MQGFRNCNPYIRAPLLPGNFRTPLRYRWPFQQLFTVAQKASRITTTPDTLPFPKSPRLKLAGAKDCTRPMI